MTKLRIAKTNFTAGEIAPQLLARGDLRAYENGARTLQNVAIHPTGGLTRRSGSYYVDTALGNGRLISFEFNADQTYLLVVTAGNITIYRQGIQVASIATPWTLDQIKNLTWAQSADTVLLCHPDVPPKKLVRLGDTSWTLDDWRFSKNTANASLQPFYKHVDETITIAPSATTGSITLTTSQPVFYAGHANTYMRIQNKCVLVTSVSSPTVVVATVLETLTSTTPTADWAEQAFSSVRGYPATSVFHQDRLVIGGSRDLPNRLWFSCSGDLWNFDKGTGLDSDSIEFGLFSDQINAIRALYSGRHLQVFTTGAEWIVMGSPLTPTSIELRRQTRVGSLPSRYVPPVDVDAATIFVGRTGRELRQFLYTDIEQAYQATDIALFARHFVIDPVDQCFDPLQRILYLPLADGTMAALTIYRTESVIAWSRFETSGQILSVATIGNTVYMLVKRQNNLYFIERFDENMYVDSALSGSTETPTTTWGGLEHLNTRDVMVIADDQVIGIKTISSNQLVLDEPARKVVVGLPYTHIIEPLPISYVTTEGGGRAVRLVKLLFRMMQSRALTVDTGNGLRDIPLQRFSHQTPLDQQPENYSGDVSVNAFGWTQDGTQSLWRIEQTTPLPCTILGATMELKVND